MANDQKKNEREQPPASEARPPLSRDEIAEIIAYHARSHALLFEDAAQEILDRIQGA
ncbi:hypothetical protein [Leisingera daeponensis]|uniref:hypothetical protein n=1 Tax=Leisingera daeponensis TaxID=405746 RepID=UPI001C947EB9|nr:hypothetical protein [Leisingera daeponensis]MBY6055352.1 hypothetical protein [Leisingera daeponensis]